MAFIDEIKIYSRAGKGGDGVVRWRREKYIDRGGPSGGDGGRGGDVYAHAVRDVHLLAKYRTKSEFFAQNGGDGDKKSLEGMNGEDLNIMLPVGSVLTNTRTDEKIRLDKEGEKILLLRGGSGGRGNESFKSSTNRSPEEWTPGKKGEDAEFYVEVELVADIGLIGLPNAGKTSLLNVLTEAKGKIGDYPFTTLEPNLGECFGYIIADIPGLIEGAGIGKGLGHKFLRHVRRTKVLVHLVSLENESPLDTYMLVRNELGDFDKELLEKKEIVVLTKTDLVDDETVKKVTKQMKEKADVVYAVSILDEVAIKELQDNLLKQLK